MYNVHVCLLVRNFQQMYMSMYIMLLLTLKALTKLCTCTGGNMVGNIICKLLYTAALSIV